MWHVQYLCVGWLTSYRCMSTSRGLFTEGFWYTTTKCKDVIVSHKYAKTCFTRVKIKEKQISTVLIL